ncbi:MAG: secretin N-terminal domain-containing protein [Candidatus Omnitrophota bacterium]
MISNGVKKMILLALAIFFISGFNFINAQDMDMKIFKLKYARAEDLYSVIDGLKSNEGRVSFDRNTNSLIISDSPKDLLRIEKIINELDVSQKQVEIEATIVEVTDTFMKDAGIQMSEIIIPSDKFMAILNLLDSSQNSHITSKAKIRTLSNQTARIQVTQDQFIGEDVIIYPSGTTIVTPERRPVGTILDVLPRVNNDNTIDIEVKPSLSTTQETTSLPFERSLSTHVVINDSDTIMLGGVTLEKQTSESQEFIKIPISRVEDKGSRKTLIFLTTKIIK